jgi:hypothetical protein
MFELKFEEQKLSNIPNAHENSFQIKYSLQNQKIYKIIKIFISFIIHLSPYQSHFT